MAQTRSKTVPGIGQGETVAFPPPIQVAAAPTGSNFEGGQLAFDPSTGTFYGHAGGGTWSTLGGGSSDVNTINSLSPTGGNINIVATAGTGINVSNAGSTVTLAGIDATEIAKGVIETATNAEADAAVSTTVALVPANLAALTATNLTALKATNAQAQAATSSAVFLTPSNLGSVLGSGSTNITFRSSPTATTNVNTGGVPTGATGDLNLLQFENGQIMEQFILGAGQTIIAPRMTTTGLLTSLDLTASEGAEYNFGMRANSPFAFTIGTSAAFYIELAVNAADVGGLDPFVVGFRKQQANAATFTDYTDFACIGARATTAADVIVIQTDLNNAGEVITNTTDAWTDGQTKTFRVLVSGAGVVTYTINGAPPTVTAAFTFDTGDVVSPFIRHLFGAATPAAINWVSLKIGFQ